MVISTYELIAMAAAISAILMLGTTNLKMNLNFYSLHTLLIAVLTSWLATVRHDIHLYFLAFFFALFKAGVIAWFLGWIMEKIEVNMDAGAFIPTPLAMVIGVGMLGISYLLSAQFPGLLDDSDGRIAAMAAMSILFTGVLLMLARKVAISQIVGFLVLENGVFLFALTQTHGMPLMIDMGILLEVLAGVMIAGLLVFRIKKSFEHIDVTQMTELRE
jgi:hydrogenase-4 component E